MRMPRFTIRRLMTAVAVAGLAMGVDAHIQGLLSGGTEYSVGVTVLEVIALGMLFIISLPVLIAVHIMRKDKAHSLWLRRTEGPDLCPLGLAAPETPEPK